MVVGGLLLESVLGWLVEHGYVKGSRLLYSQIRFHVHFGSALIIVDTRSSMLSGNREWNVAA